MNSGQYAKSAHPTLQPNSRTGPKNGRSDAGHYSNSLVKVMAFCTPRGYTGDDV